MHRTALTVATLVSSTTLAMAQVPPPETAPSDQPPADPAAEPKKKAPGRGDFDAGGQVRLPSGPDEMGQYATFNWVAADLKGKYYVFDTVTINGNVPLAIIKPEMFGGIEPKMVGGMSVTLDARLPKWNVPMAPKSKDTDAALILTGTYMREGAMLLSE
jgi:hypothetical protein